MTDQNQLQTAWKQYQLDQNRKPFLKALKKAYAAHKIHPIVEEFIFDTEKHEGPFEIRPFADNNFAHPFTFGSLWNCFDDEIVPGIWIGGDEWGSSFLLALWTGEIISLHHDASLFEVASDIHASSHLGFFRQMLDAGSAVNIKQLLEIQQGHAAIAAQFEPDSEAFAVAWIRLIAKALNASLSRLDRLIRTLPFEFLQTYCSDFVWADGIKALASADKKLARLANKSRKRVDLSRCFLSTFPDALKGNPHVTNLDLSNNAIALSGELAPLALTRLNLSGCDLREVPPLPRWLQHLDLSNNPLTDISRLLTLRDLKTLNLSNTAISKADVLRLQVAFPKTKVEIDQLDIDLSAETLSLVARDLNKLPEEIATMPNLELINLSRNPKLNWEQAFSVLSQIPTLKTIILEQEEAFVLPENCRTLQVEDVRFRNHYAHSGERLSDDDLDLQLTRLASIKTLRVMPRPPLIEARQSDNHQYGIFLKHLPNFSQITTADIPYHFRLYDEKEQPSWWQQLVDILATFPHLRAVYCRNLDHYQRWARKDPDQYDESKQRFDIPHLDKLQQVRDLTLSAQYGRLWQWPDELANLTQLESLTLYYHVHHVTENIGRMKNLRSLRFGSKADRKLYPKTISDGVKHLEQLETLTIVGNVDPLPEAIGTIPNLKTLDLSQLNVHYEQKSAVMPDSWCSLQSLETLRAPKLGIVGLPENFGQLRALKTLDLQRTPLTTLPESFGQLPNLETVELQYSKLTALPESFGQLKKLQTLNLRSTALTELPESFGQLTQLRFVEFHQTHLTKLPNSIGQLENLTTLLLDCAKLEALPDSCRNLTALQKLKLSFTGKMGSIVESPFAGIPETMYALPNLQHVELAGYRLPVAYATQLLQQIAQLENLEALRVSMPPSADSSAYQAIIGQIKTLTRLWLSDSFNQIFPALTELPLEMLSVSLQKTSAATQNDQLLLLTQIPTLRRLRLQLEPTNRKAYIPPAIAQLTQLEELRWSDYKMPVHLTVPDEVLKLNNLKVLGRRTLNNGTFRPEDRLKLMDALPNCKLVKA